MRLTFITMLLAASAATPAFAQEAEEADILVVGTRSSGRLVTESPSPVDVFSSDDLQARGLTDLNRALQYLAPSFNYPRTATGPSGANTRAATLRGLAPDQVLVLVNGKRWHLSSVLNFNNVVGRGSVPVDLGAIPVSAIERIEILRDGAAAQYGSDAIAGVINITLRSSASGGSASVQSGVTEKGDGRTLVAALNHGFAIGQGGSLNLTAELRDRGATNRAGVDSRYGRITSEQGDPKSLDINLAGSFRLPIGAVELYAQGIYDHRRSTSPAQYRAPTIAPAFYPQGFVPHIRVNLDDAGGSVGVSGDVDGWRFDLSDTMGLSDASFNVFDTVNTSLGAASPRAFAGGGARYFQNVANLDISRKIDLAAGLNLAAGVEHRHETFKLRPGEPGSYTGAGAQGFPGYNPPIPVDESRSAWSFYGDLELSPIRHMTLGAAVRHERYSDFGNATTGKLSFFYQPVDLIALRATASTGFRAPSLQQQYFSTVTSQSSGGVLVNIGTFAVSDPVAIALGASPLRRERSRNLSGGIVLKPFAGFVLSADLFHIEIADRIALSETLSGAAVTAILKAAGITNASQARFFTNALDTTTRGYEITADWTRRFGGIRANVTASYAHVDTRVDRLAVNRVIPALPLLGGPALQLLTVAQPKDKLALAARIDAGAFGLSAALVRFGSFTTTSVLTPQTYGAVTSIDLTAELKVAERFRFGIGILNLTNAYPDKTVERALTQGGGLLYPEAGAIGTNGREFFARATMTF
ncbi:MAG: TonB-dependent receptor [Pseudomonadota bacterium]|uniref:TonB-dependent receptor plug domain-containing protein n=1 Tax=Sphingomonas sp. ERG5 TaxID=1381597 RepID=UPI00054C0C46|nr:TonB-dependent receptor [Sphingomonas sp. ERG5]